MFLLKKSAKFQMQQEQMSPTPTQISVGYWLVCCCMGFAEPLKHIQVQSLRLLCLITYRRRDYSEFLSINPVRVFILSILLFLGVSSFAQEICKVRVTNTLKRTDRTLVCNAMLHEQINTLILVSVNDSREVLNLIYEKGGKCVIKHFISGVEKASKVIYRRSDLETVKNHLIYTSRTGEVTVSLFY